MAVGVRGSGFRVQGFRKSGSSSFGIGGSGLQGEGESVWVSVAPMVHDGTGLRRNLQEQFKGSQGFRTCSPNPEHAHSHGGLRVPHIRGVDHQSRVLGGPSLSLHLVGSILNTILRYNVCVVQLITEPLEQGSVVRVHTRSLIAYGRFCLRLVEGRKDWILAELQQHCLELPR